MATRTDGALGNAKPLTCDGGFVSAEERSVEADVPEAGASNGVGLHRAVPSRQLGKHMHPTVGGRYTHTVGWRTVHVHAGKVGDMLAGGLRTWDDPLVAAVLGPARENARIGEEELALLPWAMTTTSAQTPDGLGVVGRASYSGPGATSLVGNLAHPSRGYAFAAELITAACLVYREWTATDGKTVVGGARGAGARLDFGVKLIGVGTRRRSAEADILITFPDGRRAAVDVKASRADAYRHPPSPAMLKIVAQALDRQEIASFHFVTRRRFRPAVHAAAAGIAGLYLHEGVWPTAADRESIRLQEAQAVDYAQALREAQGAEGLDFDVLAELLADRAASAYRNVTAGRRSLLAVPLRFTYLFDEARPATPSDATSRLIAAWGRTSALAIARDRRFMAGFPLPRSDVDLDRGHLIALAAGGDEAVGINLIPQERRLNRGRGPDGRRWRQLERLVAREPGTGVFVRAVYDDPSDIPVRLDYVAVTPNGLVRVKRFCNRPGAP